MAGESGSRSWQPVLWVNLIGSAAAGAAFWINSDRGPIELAYGCWAISIVVALAILYIHYRRPPGGTGRDGRTEK